VRTEDGYIIRKCLDGEKEAFGFLVDKYKSSVYAFAYSKLGNFHDAEDISQEAFIKAFRKLHTLKRWDNFLAWLYSITSNLCKNFLRSKSNRPDGEFITEQDSLSFDYHSVNSYQEKQMYQRVLTLYYLGGMNSEEIAQFLGASPSAIRQQLSRARSKLKKEMLDVMNTTYDQQKLQPSFTFRIVEMVKQIKIQPAPRSTPLVPFGISAVTGIVLTILMFSPHMISLTPLGALLGSPLPSEAKVKQVGELPVDVLEISEITFLSGEQGNGNGGTPKPPNLQNAFAPPLAPSRQGDTWAKRADMPTARWYLSASAVNGKIYAIGGQNPTILSIVEEYDTVADIWTKKADMPTARNDFSTSVVDGKIYAIGGYNGNWLSTVEEYDPATNTWTKKANMPTARACISADVVDGKIYTIGGNQCFGCPALPTVEVYDPATDTWEKKADMLTPRWNLSTSVVDGKIYAIGGAVPGDVFLVTVEEYDPGTNKWTKKADMPTPRGYFSTRTVKGKIYAIGGTMDLNTSLATVEDMTPDLQVKASTRKGNCRRHGEV